METDREWEIALLEIQQANEDLILNFYLERMRPREQNALFQQQQVFPLTLSKSMIG